MNAPACLIFDLFGTLVEYEADRLRGGYHRSHASSGCTCSYETWVTTWDECFARHERRGRDQQVEFHMHDVAGDVCGELSLPAGNVADLAAAYVADWQQAVSPVPGVQGLLAGLARHYRLALISNTHYPPLVQGLLSDMDLGERFEVVALSVEVGKPKPSREIFDTTLQTLGIAAGDAVYIGDNYETDYLGATSAGMDCFLIGRHARVPRDRQLRSIMDLPIHFNTGR